MKLLYDVATSLIDRGLMPDPMIRSGIRKLLRNRLEKSVQAEAAEDAMAAFLASMRGFEAIAPVPEKANAQHYEVPAAFYDACLGRQKKYSHASTRTTRNLWTMQKRLPFFKVPITHRFRMDNTFLSWDAGGDPGRFGWPSAIRNQRLRVFPTRIHRGRTSWRRLLNVVSPTWKS